MMSFRLNCKLATVITLAGLLYLVETAYEVKTFKRCYNSLVDTHCFDAQYDTTNDRWLATSFENARNRCLDLNSTLLIINDEETNGFVRQYLNDPTNPIQNKYAWTDAYRFNDFNNNYTWHWIDSSLPTMNESAVTYTYNFWFHVAVLEFRNSSFCLTAKEAKYIFNYICEYPASKCPSSSPNNVRQFNGRCYVAISDVLVTWYVARNKCLKDGGDLASFVNVTSINFNSWLRTDQSNRYWIGLRFTWYNWVDTGEEVRYSLWNQNTYGQNTPYLVALYDDPNFNWFPKENKTTDVNVVCHTVTPFTPTTTSSSASTSTETFKKASKELNEGLAIGIGVGVGALVLIAVTVLVTCIVVRFKTRSKRNASKEATELGTVQESSAGQINESVNDRYQELNWNQDNCSEPTYDTIIDEP